MEDDGKTQNLEENLPGQFITTILNDCPFLQSVWIRRSSVWSNIVDRKFMESQLRVVLYCGSIFWVIYLFSQII